MGDETRSDLPDQPYESPPDGGLIRLPISSGPVSLQGSGPAKDFFRATLNDVTRRFRYFLSGDVKLDVEWWILERVRYESNNSPDIDNTLKLVSDSLCGPDGILFDDCQVQSISCRWVDNYVPEQRLVIEISFRPELHIDKDGLLFVHVGRSLCMPINEKLPTSALLLMLDLIEQSFAANRALLNLTHDYVLASGVLPIQRLFHRGNLKGYRIKELDFFRRELQEKLNSA
jgi:hypothetical protein